MYEHAGPGSIIWLTLIQARVSLGCCLQDERHRGHLGLVHHDGDPSAGATDGELGVVVVPGDRVGGGDGPGDDAGEVHHAGGVKEHLWSTKESCFWLCRMFIMILVYYVRLSPFILRYISLDMWGVVEI